MTDEDHAFTGVGRNFASHSTVNHSKDEYVRGEAYTNTVEGFFSSSNAASMACTSTSARPTFTGT